MLEIFEATDLVDNQMTNKQIIFLLFVSPTVHFLLGVVCRPSLCLLCFTNIIKGLLFILC